MSGDGLTEEGIRELAAILYGESPPADTIRKVRNWVRGVTPEKLHQIVNNTLQKPTVLKELIRREIRDAYEPTPDPSIKKRTLAEDIYKFRQVLTSNASRIGAVTTGGEEIMENDLQEVINGVVNMVAALVYPGREVTDVERELVESWLLDKGLIGWLEAAAGIGAARAAESGSRQAEVRTYLRAVVERTESMRINHVEVPSPGRDRGIRTMNGIVLGLFPGDNGCRTMSIPKYNEQMGEVTRRGKLLLDKYEDGE